MSAWSQCFRCPHGFSCFFTLPVAACTLKFSTDRFFAGPIMKATFVLAPPCVVDEAPQSRTSELLSREVQESMGIVWRRNHPRSHVLTSSVALFEELLWRLLFCAPGSSGPLVREHVKTLTRSLEWRIRTSGVDSMLFLVFVLSGAMPSASSL